MKDSRECPRYHADREAMDWLSLFRHYRDGHLYRSGGVSDQPALYLSVMRLMQSAMDTDTDG